MKKIYIYSLFIIALSFAATSCQKEELYRPGGADTQLNSGSETTPNPVIDPIVDEDEQGGGGKG
jgi:hypothetical protein